MQTACSLSPCQNGGQCTVKDGGTNYTCTCTNHTGRNCEVNVCSPNPCQNGGQCTVKDGGTNYTCGCVGHTGRNCEINMCSPNPCQNGGLCTVNYGGTNYTCTCTIHTVGRNCEINCVLFDFESGRLDGWTMTGTALNNQPTYGDNPYYRFGERSNLKGDWSIATFEYRPSPFHSAGERQGDPPTGTATSPSFVIHGRKLRFLIGGNSDPTKCRLELLIGGNVVDKTASDGTSNSM
ncbi:Fat-like cadherin-related tumor suppressor-like, partial [Exaiptasia diaphana]